MCKYQFEKTIITDDDAMTATVWTVDPDHNGDIIMDTFISPNETDALYRTSRNGLGLIRLDIADSTAWRCMLTGDTDCIERVSWQTLKEVIDAFIKTLPPLDRYCYLMPIKVIVTPYAPSYLSD